MERFKKRTIALVLASVVTVVGAFGADNYKNSLMSLEFKGNTSDAVELTILTKTNYENTITPIKKDAQTYVIMLPETSNSMSSMPSVSGNIQSVDVKTLPYTTSGKGYTKITVTTTPNTTLNASKALYLPEKNQNTEPQNPTKEYKQNTSTQRTTPTSYTPRNRENYYDYNTNNTEREVQRNVVQTQPIQLQQQYKNDKIEENVQENPIVEQEQQTEQTTQSDNSSSEVLLLILGIILVIFVCAFLYIQGKNKLAEVLGEQQNFDLNDEPKKKKTKSKSQQIRNKINNIDRMYSKPITMPISSFGEKENIPQQINTTETQDNAKSEEVVLDLDELFQQQSNESSNNVDVQTQEDENNDALDQFLLGFSEMQAEEEALIAHEKENDELFDKYINDNSLKFSNEDIERINKLINTEISDDTIKNINKYAATNPIVKTNSQAKMLENFMTTYAINQNISFSKDDVDALNKLINVELDPDFVKDLRTNPQRTLEMQKEIGNRKHKPHKVAEILTLNVKDMLPDLSEALRKQGNKRIESEVKPQVVYYSEGFDVNILSTKNVLPDLSKAILNNEDNEYKPSEEIELAASGYDVSTLATGGILPDLADVMTNPQKYEEKEPKKQKVDEEALLKNIANVTFKPFYDGTENFEIINEFDSPTTEEVKNELNIFGDFEVITDDSTQETFVDDSKDDFEALYNNEYYDLDKIHEKDNHKTETYTEERTETTNIEPNVDIPAELTTKTETTDNDIRIDDNSIISNGIRYNIVKKTEFTNNIGCYLTESNNKYTIMGYVKEKIFVIKQYENLSSKNMQARASEILPDGTTRYIIKIGANNKFILNLSGDNMEYVMDLC